MAISKKDSSFGNCTFFGGLSKSLPGGIKTSRRLLRKTCVQGTSILSILYRCKLCIFRVLREAGVNSKGIFRLSAIGISIPPPIFYIRRDSKVAKELPANSLAGYRISTYQGDAARKILQRSNLNARIKVCAPHDLSIYSNSGYLYAIAQIALELLGVRRPGNFRFGNIVYDLRNLNAFPKYDCRR